ncbi:MAG: hypothetical protein HY685_00205 [Chloroflexi bacterium]|nr:hypothetical protein [Chloroflexota bacterium]
MEESRQNAVPASAVELPNLISIPRVVWASIFSFGMYSFYWFYLTWKQYRDHTNSEAYPAWHALTLLVPIYGWFRLHAHVRSYVELMGRAGVASSIAPGPAVGAYIAGGVSSGVGGLIDNIGSAPESSAEFAGWALFLSLLLTVIGIGITIWMVAEVQRNLNRYWTSLPNVRVVTAPVGIGEIIVIVAGMSIFVLSFVLGFIVGFAEGLAEV